MRFVENPDAEVRGKVLALVQNGAFVDQISEGDEALILLDETPFYAEMGGQVGDTGELVHEKGAFSVVNCVSPYKGVTAHVGKLSSGSIALGDYLNATIDKERRQNIANNHTATHLLHWALHQVLGEHIKQAGSVVDPSRLRFDFSHHKALTEEDIRTIERLVNEKIRHNQLVAVYELSYNDAQKRDDIKQFFGDKYGNVVRVIDIDFSKELCGGTHTRQTGTIGYFRIQKESSIAAGIRRIEAVTGKEAEELAYSHEETVKIAASHLKTIPSKLLERIEKELVERKALETKCQELQKEKLEQIAKNLPLEKSEKAISYCIQSVQATASDLRELQELIKLPSGVICLACVDQNKVHMVVKVSQDLIANGFNASTLLKEALTVVDGSGGGKADSAQGAGKATDKLSLALDAVKARL
jgi:alanyl-tRNA synthetase